MDDLIDKTRQNFEGVLEILSEDLATVKTGKARPNLIEKVLVEAYEGQEKMPLIELASITAPDPNQLIVSPWDKSILEAVEKALAASNKGVNPVVDGNLIRINIPPLTEERRRDLVRLTKQKLESGKVMLRQERSKIKEIIDARKGGADVSEDDIHQAIKRLDEATDRYSAKIDEMGKAKEGELMRI